MSDKHEAVSIFTSHVEAEAAVLELQKAGFDIKKFPSSVRIMKPLNMFVAFSPGKIRRKLELEKQATGAAFLVDCSVFSLESACYSFRESVLSLWLGTLPEC